MRRAVRRVLGAIACVAGTGCGDSGAPTPPPAVKIVFLDDLVQLNTLQSGGTPQLTALTNVLPFAASRGAIYYLAPRVVVAGDNAGRPVLTITDSGGLRRYHPESGMVDTFPLRYFDSQAFGAATNDGRLFAYTTIDNDSVHLNTFSLETGERRSVNVTGTVQAPASEQIGLATPTFSPSGDSLVFLLPNFLGMQMLVYEPRTGRYDVRLLRVQVTTFYEPLQGWPRWTARDNSVRFLARLKSNLQPTDTLAVVRIFPREPDRPNEMVYAARVPDSLSIASAKFYSFSEDGNTVVMSVATTQGKTGLFAMRAGHGTLETLLYDGRVTPRYPLLIP
jgi:hypothetical protein